MPDERITFALELINRMNPLPDLNGNWFKELRELLESLAKETSYTIPDSPKMLRETLCAASNAINGRMMGRNQEHLERLDRLIKECDRHRPLGVNGKHANLHTDTCGCEDKGPRESWGTVRPLVHQQHFLDMCPLCWSQERKNIGEDYRAGNDTAAVNCPDCLILLRR